MATTSPDNIWTPDTGDAYALTVDLAATADTVQDALTALRSNGAISGRGTTANRPAAGNLGVTYRATDTGILWYDNGSAWKNRTPGIFAQVTSATGLVNGTTSPFTWNNGVPSMFVDTAGFFNAGTPTRITVPYTGTYDVSFALKSNGVSGITSVLAVNGVAVTSYMNGSGGPGVAGTAVTAARSVYMNLTAGDYITIAATSGAAALGSHSIAIKYLGEP